MAFPLSFKFARCAVLAGLLAGVSGCGITSWFSTTYNRTHGTPAQGEYTGLAGKSVAIIVYVPETLVNNYPQAATEISEFFRVSLLKGVPTVRMRPIRDVTNWQRSTDWTLLSDKAIGEHFGVERVVRIELINYQTQGTDKQGLVRGYINTNVRVAETGAGEDGKIAWQKAVTAEWPLDGPVEMTRVNQTIARQRTLEAYSETLARAFYNQ